MKKKLILLAVVLVLTGIAIAAVLLGGSDKKEESKTTEELLAEHAQHLSPEVSAAQSEADPAPEAEEDASEAAASDVKTVGPEAVFDGETLYNSHDADEIVMTVNCREITWREYFYWISYYTSYIQYYMQMYSYYGMSYNWTDIGDESETMTVAESVIADTDNHVGMECILEQFAEENNIGISREQQDEIDLMLREDIEANCGKGATEADFEELLASEYLTLELYKKFTLSSYNYQNCFTWLYGENGEKVSDEEALDFLDKYGYIRANHILIMTSDPSTGEEFSEEETEKAEALARELSLELQKINDINELLKRFAELKEQYCEDTGKTSYPDGYVFEDGTMVPEFENASKALEEYQVSDPVKSDYGYHIIIRLPHDPDAVVEYSQEGTAVTARGEYANISYSEIMQTKYDAAEIVKADSIKNLNLLDYLISAEN